MGSIVVNSAAFNLGFKPGYGTISTVSDASTPKHGADHNSLRPGGLSDLVGVGLLSHDGAEPNSRSPLSSTEIPFPRDLAFVDRPDILDRIDELCSSPGSRAALVGISGIGKSQLAIEYAYRNREAALSSTAGGSWVSWILDDAEPADAARCVFWIRAATLTSIAEGFRAIAKAAGIPNRDSSDSDIIQTICQWLGNERLPAKWLLVFDGADNRDIFLDDILGASNKTLAQILPHSSRGSILFTTSDRGLARGLTSQPQAVIDVGPMELEEAILLLERKMGASYGRLGTKADLVEELDLIPLAIVQAAFHIRDQRHMTLDTYLQALRESDISRIKLLGTGGDDSRRGLVTPRSALDTWQATLLQIRAVSPSAADLLCLLSFFDHREIHEVCLHTPNNNGVASSLKINGIVSNVDPDLTILHNHCLIASKASGGIEMSRLVQISIRAWLTAQGCFDKFNTDFVTRLNGAFTSCKAIRDGNKPHENLVPHAEMAAARRPDSVQTQLAWASLLHESALHQVKQGRFYGAEHHAALSCHQLLLLRSVTHHDTQDAQKTLHKTLELLQPQPGLLPLAIDTATSILGGRHGVQDLQRFHSTVEIAAILLEQGQPKGATLLCEAERAILKHRLGDDHPHTLRVTAKLGSIFTIAERFIEAENLLSRALDVYQLTLGKEDPTTLDCMEELATAHARQGKLHKAEQSFLNIIESRKRVLGETHPSTLSSMRRMSSEILWSAGHECEAQEMLTHVLKLHKEALGDEDDNTATCMYDLAGMFMAHGNYTRSDELLCKVISVRKKTRGPNHLLTLTSMSDLAGIYNIQSRWEDAEKILPEAIEGKSMLLGGEHGDTITDMRALAEVYMARSRWQEAEILLTKVIDGQTELLGANHEETMASEEMFYEVMRKQGCSGETINCLGSGGELLESEWSEQA